MGGAVRRFSFRRRIPITSNQHSSIIASMPPVDPRGIPIFCPILNPEDSFGLTDDADGAGSIVAELVDEGEVEGVIGRPVVPAVTGGSKVAIVLLR